MMNRFSAYLEIASNRYRETFGLYFEDFAVGQKFKHRPGITISQQDNKDEALDTINNAQLHYDANYASKTEWQHCLGVSTMTLQRLLGASWKTFAKKKHIVAYDDIAMTHPVFDGDTLYAESEILAKQMYADDPTVGLVKVQTNGMNQAGDIISKITYQILIYKKNQHPFDKMQSFKLTEAEKFYAHRQLADGSFMEEVGLYLEDLAPGEVYEHRPAKTFTFDEARVHALRTLEWNPMYSDLEYMKVMFGDKLPINENFLIGSITALTTRTFGRVVANLQWKDIQLASLVYAGDTIHAESEIISKRNSHSRLNQGIIEATTKAYNQKNELVVSFNRHFLIYRKGLGPYEVAGY